MNKEKLIMIFSIIIICILFTRIIIKDYKKEKSTQEFEQQVEKSNKNDYKFDLSLIKEVNKLNNENNYLISPYSIEIALNMLKEGAKGNTYKEIENLVGTRYINDISVKDKINVANAIFVKEEYKSIIEKSFVNSLTKNYYSDVIYDKFKSPDLINKWAFQKTNGMIEKILDSIDSNFALGLANALAIDVDWYSQFDCNDTQEYPFIKDENNIINVEMMYYKYKSAIEYFQTDNSQGVIIPYNKYDSKTGQEVYVEKEGKQLEFIGILPNEDINSYVDNLTNQELTNIDNNKQTLSSDEALILRIPRFSYDYDLKEFVMVLNNLGIKDSFDYQKADFTKIISKEKMQENIYLGQAIHKTHIDFNEKGTKAAAITYFEMRANSAFSKDTIKEIIFDKPFIYIIRDKDTKELLFFGTVYEPNIWHGNTCN